MTPHSGYQRGISLLETLLLVALVGAALGTGLLYLQAGDGARDSVRQQQALGWADQAVAGFALHYGRLPCPAAAPMGEEDCNSVAGWLPLGTLDPHNRGVDMQQMHYALAGGAYLATPRDLIDLGAGVVNELDFCAELSSAGTPEAMAYGVAIGAPYDSGLQHSRQRGRSLGELSGSLFCSGLAMSLDGLGVAQDVTVEVYDQRLWSLFSIATSAAVNGLKTTVSGVGVVMAAAALVRALLIMKAAAAGLAAAISSCFALVGCALIPSMAAAVVASAAAIVSATAGLALTATSAALSATATGLAVALAVSVGTAPDDLPVLDFSGEITAIEQVLGDMDEQLLSMQGEHGDAVLALADLQQQRDMLRDGVQQDAATMDPQGVQQPALDGLFDRLDQRSQLRLEMDRINAQYERQQQALDDTQAAMSNAESEYQQKQQAFVQQQALPDGHPDKNVEAARLQMDAADAARVQLQQDYQNLQNDLSDSLLSRQQTSQQLNNVELQYANERAQLAAEYEALIAQQRADATCGAPVAPCVNPPPPGCTWQAAALSCAPFDEPPANNLLALLDEYGDATEVHHLISEDEVRQRGQISEMQARRDETLQHLAALRALEETAAGGEQDDDIWRGADAILEQADRRGALR